jgi:hypothetical protein
MFPSGWRAFVAITFGTGIAASVLCGATPARAGVAIVYDFEGDGDNGGLTFDYKKGNQPVQTDGELYGEFALTCSYTSDPLDCVTYNGTPGSSPDTGWTVAVASNGDLLGYSFQALSGSVTWSYNGTSVTSSSGFYGYTNDGAYFIQFAFDPDPSNSPTVPDGEYIILFLSDDPASPPTTSDPLPLPGGEIPLTSLLSVTPGQLYQSSICSNTLPPPSNIRCPGGGTFSLSNFDGNVVAVPSPFAGALLLPVVLLGKVRRRYSGVATPKQS